MVSIITKQKENAERARRLFAWGVKPTAAEEKLKTLFGTL
jgi:hypothetical protein